MNLYQKWCLKKAVIKFERLHKFYKPDDAILDIGCGNGALVFLLKNSNKNIVGIDIANKSAFDEINPVIYDGKKLPFDDNAFDVVQLITVLHHIKDPESVLKEAQRVGKKLIVMEDIYEGRFQKYLTFFADSINNLEFIGHPHSNKTDLEWRQLFEQHNLQLTAFEYYDFLFFFKQITYCLQK